MELNILLRGQSNAILFDQLGGYAAVQTDVDQLLGFDGVTNKVNILGGATPDAEGNVTAVGATALLPPVTNHWLNLVNGDYTQGFTAGPIEQGLLNYIGDLPADERAAPTAVLYMHDESDASIAGGETTAEWMAGVQYEAGLVRQAFGQTAATVPYLFVPVPFDADDAATMQAIRLGQEQLAADPAFNGAVATHTGDLNMDNSFNGLPAGDVIYGGPHIDQQDADILAARIAPSVADAFAQYALPGSPLALASGHVDDSGPQAVRVDWVPAQPTQVIVTLQNDPSALGLEPLGAEAAAGLGWTIRDGDSSIAATSAQELPGNQLLLTFAGAVPTDATALLFYDYGTGRLAVGATTHTGSGYPGTGVGSPGEGNGIYDTDGLPAWASAAGVPLEADPVAYVVGAMQSSAGLTLYEGDTLTVLGGGVQSTTVLTGGVATLLKGGSGSGTVVDGGTVVVASGGSAALTTVSGGSETVLSGGMDSGSTVLAGGKLLLSGGMAQGEAIGGSVVVGSGGMLLASTILGGGIVTVGDGGVVSGSFQDAGDVVFDIARSAAPDASFSGSGSITVTGGGTLTLASVSALTGMILVSGSTLDLAAPSAAGSATAAFEGNGGLLVLDTDNSGSVIAGLTPDGGQTIEVEGFAAMPTLEHLGDTVVLAAAGMTTDLDIVGSADYAIALTAAQSGGDGQGLSVSLTEGATPCYCDGTAILTDRGEVPVEELAIGDRVMTVSGASEVIRWIGRRSFTRRLLQGQPALLPILFRAGSLGVGVPRRDLRVSPAHAMFLDGLLVPAGCLVNGVTILQEHGCQQIAYFHVELERHDVILAEGAASETFLDDDSRGMFHNASEFGRLYPDAAGRGGFCAPRVTHGYALEAIRRRLAALVEMAAEAA